MRIFAKYIVSVVYCYFYKKDTQLAKTRTINFMVLLELSSLVPFFAVLNAIFQFYKTPEEPNENMKYIIGIPLALISIAANTWYLKNKLDIKRQQQLVSEYEKRRFKIHAWFLFILPILFAFGVPILYGALNGTLRIIQP